MKGKKKKIKNTNEGFNVDDEILQIIRNILNFLEKIFIKLHPLLKKIFSMNKTRIFRENGTFRDLIKLLDDISKQYKKLSLYVFKSALIHNHDDLKT